MSLRENEVRQSRRAQRKHRKQQDRKQKAQSPGIGHNLGPPLNDDQVLTFAEWVRLNRVSPRNGRRILQSGTGPRVVQLSARRIGITIRANREWQASKTR
jgi:hypothetical protein